MSGEATPALALAGVHAAYGARVALDDVDLTLAPGGLLALLGPNGAGKSTLVTLAVGLRSPGAGTVRVCGRDPRADRAARRLVGLAAQEIGLYPSLTVRQNLWAVGELYGLTPGEARARALALAGPFGLEEIADRAAGTLSGGERRRVHTAAALVHGPRLALLDEPTAGADPRTREAILDAVRGLVATGVAVVYTTHYLHEVEALGADVVVLEAGRAVAEGAQDEIVARHGAAALVLELEGPVPDWLRAKVTRHGDGGRLVLETGDPAATLREVMGRLGPDAARLTGIEIVRGTLEAAYLALTGRRTPEEERR